MSKRSEGVYVNTLDVTATEQAPGRFAGSRLVAVVAPEGFPLLAGWQIGIDGDEVDEPSIRVSAQLQAGPAGAEYWITPPPVETLREVLGDYLYRVGRPLRGAPLMLPAPYDIEEGETLYGFVKVRANVELVARASFFLYFVDE